MKPLKGLSPKARKLWVEMVDAWEIEEPASFMLLGELCASFDRLQAAKALLAASGPVLVDRFGQKKPSPLCVIVRDETATLVRLQNALGLDLEESQGRPGRPDGYEPEAKP